MGRHAHIDDCRTEPGKACKGAEVEHINIKIPPNPEAPKDWITHKLFWERSGRHYFLFWSTVAYSGLDLGFKGQPSPVSHGKPLLTVVKIHIPAKTRMHLQSGKICLPLD